jgi:thioesterase domain-containing protein
LTDPRRARLEERRSQLSDEQRRRLEERLRGSATAAPAPVRCLVEITPAPASGRAPFFCVHPAGGDVLCFVPLARHLGPDQPFYGLQSRGLEDDAEPFTTIEEMAEHYVAEIRSVQPSGPYRIGGWSFGGLAAFAMAHRLRAEGEEVALLAIVDTGPGFPDGAPPLRDEGEAGDPSRQLLDIAEYVRVLRGHDLGLAAEDLRGLDAEAQIRLFVERVQATGLMQSGDSQARVRRLLRVQRANILAYRAYRARPWPGRITVFHGTRGDAAPEGLAPDLGWAPFSPEPVEVYALPGDHIRLMAEPHIRALAARLRARLDPES